MSENECIDPNEPTVDNSSLECEDLISSDCIISEDADVYLRYGKGSTLSTILGLISKAIQKLTNAQRDYLPTYKSYVVILDQDGISDPTAAAVVHNGLGITPTLARTTNGEYTMVSTGAFPASKTQIIPPNSIPAYVAGAETQLDKFYAERTDDDTITINTARKSGGSTNLTDGLLDGLNTILEIRVYD